MKQRGLTPLFHFLEKTNKKMRLSEKSETAGSDPFVSFFGKKQTKKCDKAGKEWENYVGTRRALSVNNDDH